MITGMPLARASLVIGNSIFTDLSNLIQLGGFFSGAANKYATLRNMFDAAGYAVPAGKTLDILALSMTFTGTPPTKLHLIGYGDNDVGWDTNTAPTNAKTPAGQFINQVPNLAATYIEKSCFISIPTGKYAYVQAESALGAGVFGYYQFFGYLR